MVENQTENAPEMVENQTEVVEQATPDPIEQRKADNLVQMRRKLEAAEEAAREAQKRAEEAERRSSYREEQPVQAPQNDNDDSIDIEDEDYVQAKYVKNNAKKVNSKLSAATLELQALRQEVEALKTAKTIDKFGDFDDVVSRDNLKTLERLYPDEYEVIMSSNNLKAKSVAAYNTMLKYGIVEAKGALKQAEQLKAVDKRIDDNKLRPGSLAAARSSSSPLVNASRYDADGRLVLTEADRDIINANMRRKLGLD